MKAKQIITVIFSLLAIFGSGIWMYQTQFAPPKINLLLHRGVGERLAQESSQALGGKGKLLVVTMERGHSETLDVQLRAFLEKLKTSPDLKVVDTERVENDEGSSKYGPGAGLSARRLSRLLEKNKEIDVLVSFIGLPELEEKEIKALGSKPPRLVAFARSTKKLLPLMDAGLVQAVAVPRFQFPAPGTNDPRTAAEWFDLRFQVLTPKATPKKEG